MNTLNSSGKPEKSLTLLSDFENHVVQDSDLNNLSLSEIKTLMEMVKFYLNSLNEEKRNFILTTSIRENTSPYNKQIALFNQRKAKINKSYMIIESRLRQEKEKFNQQEHERTDKENHFMFFFLKNSSIILDNATFDLIVKETEKKYEFPKSLKERI